MVSRHAHVAGRDAGFLSRVARDVPHVTHSPELSLFAPEDEFMIDRIDHIVLNCRDVEATAAWYERVLGFERETFFGPIERIALKFGAQKINLRPIGVEGWITGEVEAAGSLDLCFVTDQGLDAAAARLRAEGVEIIRGPSTQRGALGTMTSIYFRDPEGSLLEIASYDPADARG